MPLVRLLGASTHISLLVGTGDAVTHPLGRTEDEMSFTHPQRALAAIVLISFFVLLLIWPGWRD